MDSIERYGVEYASGTVLGDLVQEEFERLLDNPEELALRQGWANGCPVVAELIANRGTYTESGAEVMARRYSQVNFWYGYAVNRMYELNPGLHHWFTRIQDRLPDEPRGDRYEPQNVPERSSFKMWGLGTVHGYVLPRLILEVIGEDESKKGENLDFVLLHLDEAIRESDGPIGLLSDFGERLAVHGIDTKRIFKHILSIGKLSEDNTYTDYRLLKQTMESYCPTLWTAYINLSPKEKSEFKIA